MLMEDAKILELYFARSEDAIRQTDKSYGRKLHTLANRILFSREDAQECVSDTYLKAWNAIPPKRPQYFYAYLAAICRNLSLHRLERRQTAKRSAQVVELTQEMEQCIPDTRQSQRIEQRELSRMLDGFLGTLNQETRQIFLRRYWFGDTVPEIAARYGMTESKVKMQLSRTRGKLRTALEKEGAAL